MRKRIISLLLCLCLFAALLPARAAAAEGTYVTVNFNIGADYTFEGGKIYRICLNQDGSAITVEKGATLTVEAGAIIEFGVNVASAQSAYLALRLFGQLAWNGNRKLLEAGA